MTVLGCEPEEGRRRGETCLTHVVGDVLRAELLPNYGGNSVPGSHALRIAHSCTQPLAAALSSGTGRPAASQARRAAAPLIARRRSRSSQPCSWAWGRS